MQRGEMVRTELIAGATTFLAMAYIIFVQSAVLSGAMLGTDTGMDFGAVTTAACLSAALATIIMGLYANYSAALAPGCRIRLSIVVGERQGIEAVDVGAGGSGAGVLHLCAVRDLETATVRGCRDRHQARPGSAFAYLSLSV